MITACHRWSHNKCNVVSLMSHRLCLYPHLSDFLSLSVFASFSVSVFVFHLCFYLYFPLVFSCICISSSVSFFVPVWMCQSVSLSLPPSLSMMCSESGGWKMLIYHSNQKHCKNCQYNNSSTPSYLAFYCFLFQLEGKWWLMGCQLDNAGCWPWGIAVT